METTNQQDPNPAPIIKQEIPCQMCLLNNSIYRCPSCFYRTCSLKCCLLHKQQTSCTGKRDRAGFVPLRDFSDSTLASDFHFLEDVLQQSARGKRLIEDLGLKGSGNGGGGGRGNGSNGENKRKRMDRYQDPETEEAPMHPLSKLRLVSDTMESLQDDTQSSAGNQTKAGTGTPNTNPNGIEPLIQVAEGISQTQTQKPKPNPITTMMDPSLSQYSKAKQRLVQMARERKIRLLLMPPMMQRHITNTSTRFDIKKNLIYWKVEFIFHILSGNSDNHHDHANSSQVQAIVVLDRIPEDEPLLKHLMIEFEKQLSHCAGSETRCILGHFREKTSTAKGTVTVTTSSADKAIAVATAANAITGAGTESECKLKSNAVTLMKQIPCQSSQPKYHKLDMNQCLKDMLSGLAIIEFPTIEVVLKEDAKCFPLLIEEVE